MSFTEFILFIHIPLVYFWWTIPNHFTRPIWTSWTLSQQL